MARSLAARRRTLFIQALTRLPHERVRAGVGVARSGGAGARALSPLLWWLGRGPVRVADGPAAGLRLARADVVACHIQAFGLVRGTLELPVQEALRRTLGPGATLYDIGANIGFFSLLGARLAGPRGHVFAFEPHPQSAALIAASARANDLETITILPLALGAAAGRAHLLDVREPSWSHLASYGEHPQSSGSLPVEVAAIDELLEQGRIRPPTVVKLDAEGAELDILAGMSQALSSHRPAVICELHATNEPFADFMESAGYAVENLDGPEPVRSAGPEVHVLALPRAA
ncbi:MAG TPA: FkbM family methyltransferase [Solirubrobacteraceae bacterium]|nr:FkbM family methyltransferase [Solirubrobacteraceae bacterium]